MPNTDGREAVGRVRALSLHGVPQKGRDECSQYCEWVSECGGERGASKTTKILTQ